jgi:hypothetical protein
MPHSLTGLPVEIIQITASHLTNSAIKTLRLTCKTLSATVQLRLDRVFLSANPLNIAVFLAVANSNRFRHGVKEIIWDDARFVECLDGALSHVRDPPTGCPAWFVDACKENIEELHFRKGQDIDRPDHVDRAEQVAAELPAKICWQYYQNLFYQQEDVIIFNRDAEALRYGLPRFPALRRVTITPAAHGWLFAPLYKTPMIRAFPKGFNYPIPRSWPNVPSGEWKPEALPWKDEQVRQQYRGFSIVTRALADCTDHQVSEFIVDVNYLGTGLNSRVFEHPCAEYEDLVTILRRPGFKRLDLDLLVGHQELIGWPCFNSGHFYRAIAEARALEHISLHTNVEPDSRASFVPMRTLFPVEDWPALRHFELSCLIVDQDDLVALLDALPDTLRSVHLSFLYFPDNRGTWRGLLQDIRDKLDWRTRRGPSSRPRVTVGTATQYVQFGHAVWVDEEVQAFLYADGPNPFVGNEEVVISDLGVVRDSFEPAYKRPNVSSYELAKLGYLKDPMEWVFV